MENVQNSGDSIRLVIDDLGSVLALSISDVMSVNAYAGYDDDGWYRSFIAG